MSQADGGACRVVSYIAPCTTEPPDVAADTAEGSGAGGGCRSTHSPRLASLSLHGLATASHGPQGRRCSDVVSRPTKETWRVGPYIVLTAQCD